MIDQRVSQGIKSNFLIKRPNNNYTCSICKKFNCKIVPIYIERKNNEKFILEIMIL